MSLTEFQQPVHDYQGVALSIAMAIFASYVSLDLAKRVHRRDPYLQAFWAAGGGIVMGTGIWTTHFIGMLSMNLPIQVGYDWSATLMSWVAAVSTSGLALYISSRPSLTRGLLVSGATVMGLGICAMHYLGMAALVMSPAIVWNMTLVILSVLVAFTISALALSIFFWMRRLAGSKAQAAQIAAALLMGLAISAMHYIGDAAANYPALLHKSGGGRVSPDPGRIYATTTVSGRPRWVKRLRSAARICSSAT